ncbi:MAG TPA: acyltransferase, partial [Herpetosiphonaceae bacterium]|nr:acyltransferase [Herpetosiphonaceae bacterium]
MNPVSQPALVAADARPAHLAPGGAPQGRFEFLDMMRGVAALTVVIYHIVMQLAPETGWMRLFDLGDFGVGLFFLCSGFIIPVSLENSQSLKRFWVRRVFRLYPLYWINIVCWLLAVYVFQLGRFSSAQINASPVTSVAANATLLQQLLGVDNLVPLYWTLNLELIFYGVVSLLFATRLLAHKVAISYAFIAAAIIVEGLAPLLLRTQISRNLGFLAMMFVGTVWHGVASGAIELAVAKRALLWALLMEAILALRWNGDLGQPEVVISALAGQLAAYGVFMAIFQRRARS